MSKLTKSRKTTGMKQAFVGLISLTRDILVNGHRLDGIIFKNQKKRLRQKELELVDDSVVH